MSPQGLRERNRPLVRSDRLGQVFFFFAGLGSLALAVSDIKPSQSESITEAVIAEPVVVYLLRVAVILASLYFLATIIHRAATNSWPSNLGRSFAQWDDSGRAVLESSTVALERLEAENAGLREALQEAEDVVRLIGTASGLDLSELDSTPSST